jgi:GNAT superfamily N-acetyltransferase
MESLNRDDRQALRSIQAYMGASMLDAGAVLEQVGTLDVYIHPTNPDPYLNCASPHRGVAWVRRDDLNGAFAGLQNLGRIPRLVFQEALFPQALQQQLKAMGLTLEHERQVMAYRPVYGPNPPNEEPIGRLPDTLPDDVTTQVATSKPDLATWLRVFRSGYYNAETLTVDPADVEPLIAAANQRTSLFVTASYRDTPLGAARVGLRSSTAELEAVVTAPLWHGMGLEAALVMTATREAMEGGCDVVFTVAQSEDFLRLCRRLGFVEVTRVLTFWLIDQNDSTYRQGVPLFVPSQGEA